MKSIAWALAALLPCFGCTGNQSGNVAATTFGDLQYGHPTFGTFDADLRAACGSGQPTTLGDSEMTRLPYLQDTTANSTRVLWVSPDNASLEVRPASARNVAPTSIDATVDTSAVLPAGSQWLAQAGGLASDAIYCYRIVGAAGPWTDWTGFRTPPQPGQTVELSVFGDLGEATADQEELLSQLENLHSQLVLVTGDVAYPNGGLQDFENNFFSVYSDMLDEVPFFPAGGNHDYNSQGGEPFREVFSLPENGGPQGLERWYSFDWGDIHVVALDTEAVGQVQADWLDADLTAHANARWTLVILHRPAYSSGVHGDTASVKQYFVPIFDSHHVNLVLAGHDHDYERFAPKNGVLYVVTGGGGVGTRPITGKQGSAFAEDVIHLVHLMITPDQLTGWAVDATGQVFDTFRIDKAPAAP